MANPPTSLSHPSIFIFTACKAPAPRLTLTKMDEDLDEAIALLSPPFSDVSAGEISDWESEDADGDFADNDGDIPMSDGADDAEATGEHKDSVTGIGLPTTDLTSSEEEEGEEEDENARYSAFTSLQMQQRHEKSEAAFAAKMEERRTRLKNSPFFGELDPELDKDFDPENLTMPEELLKNRQRQVALKILLEAWRARLGVREKGWTWYDEKTSTKAVLAIREILDKGDEELGSRPECIEYKASWEARMKRVKWWFVNTSVAIDFLSAFDIGEARFGSGMVRVEVHRFVRHDDIDECVHPNHRLSMAKWATGSGNNSSPHLYPTFRPCGCYEFRLLMKLFASSSGWPSPTSAATIKQFSDGLTAQWVGRLKAQGLYWPQGAWPSPPRAPETPLVKEKIGGEEFSF